MRSRNRIPDAIESVCGAQRGTHDAQNDEEDVEPDLTAGDAWQGKGGREKRKKGKKKWKTK